MPRIRGTKVLHDRETGRFLPKLTTELKPEIEKHYWAGKMSARDIGHLYGVDQRTVTKFMERQTIPRRTKQEAVKLQGSRDKVAQAKLGGIPWNKGLDKSDKRVHSYAEKLSIVRKGMRHTQEFKDMIRAMNLKRWANPEYKERLIKNILKGLMKRPTSLERHMIEIINHHHLPFKYVGDGSFLIGYKNPDFIESNGRKVCIEVTNSYYHDTDWANRRQKHFAKYGWRCIIFFERDINTQSILDGLWHEDIAC